MKAHDSRVVKSKLASLYEQAGFKISATDTPSIVLFSDRPLTKKSKKYSKQQNLIKPYLTSFGEKEALKKLGRL